MTTNRLKTRFKIRRVIHFLMPYLILFSTAVRNVLYRYPLRLEFWRAVLNRESLKSFISGYLEVPNIKKKTCSHKLKPSLGLGETWTLLCRSISMTSPGPGPCSFRRYIEYKNVLHYNNEENNCYVIETRMLFGTSTRNMSMILFQNIFWGHSILVHISHIEHMYIGLYFSLTEK